MQNIAKYYFELHVYVQNKKVAHTRLPSVGFRSWSRFLAVSLQEMWVTNPAVCCHYFPPGLQLPPQPLWGLLQILLPPLSIYGTVGRTPVRYIDPAPHTLRTPLIRLLEHNSIAVVIFISINSLRLKDWYWRFYLDLATKFNCIIRTATFSTLLILKTAVYP